MMTHRRAIRSGGLIGLLLLLLSCNGGADGDAGQSGEAASKMADRYYQPYVNIGRNSYMANGVTATGDTAEAFVYNETEIPAGVRFIHAVDERRAIVDFGEVFFAVNLPHKLTLGFRVKSNKTFIRLTDGGEFVFFDHFQLVKQDFDRFKETAPDYFVTGLGQYSQLFCLLPAGSTFVAGIQDWGNPRLQKRSFTVFEKQYDDLENWRETRFDGAVLAPPISSKGTVVVARTDTISTVGPDGALRDILTGSFKPLGCSVGPDDLVYVVLATEEGMVLRCLALDGQQQWQAEVILRALTQPPLVDASGRVWLIGPGLIAAYENGEATWQNAAGESPMATAGTDGRLVVVDGSWVRCYDDYGEAAWEYEDPDGEIWRTPPVIEAAGSVLTASDRKILRIR